MKIFLLSFFIASVSSAAVLKARISEIDKGEKQNEPHLIKMEDGKVAYLDHDSKYLDSVETHYEYQSVVGFDVDEKNQIMNMTVYYPEEKPRGGTRCTDWKSYHPKSCGGFTIP